MTNPGHRRPASRCEVQTGSAASPVFKRTWEFIGGPREGTGSGEYVHTSVVDGVGWDTLEGEYGVP